VLLIAHFCLEIPIENEVLFLVGMTFLVWFLPFVTRIKVGDHEIELGRRIQETEEKRQKDAEFVAAFTDASTEVDGTGTGGDENLTPEQLSVLHALADERFTLRTVTGVFKTARTDSGGAVSTKAKTEGVLQELLDLGMARTALGKSNTFVWGLTPTGRANAIAHALKK